MTAEAAVEFEALEAQAAALMAKFTSSGYERVAPAFIQPAGLFLDRIGEAMRSRMYVFTDPSGEELCLRPDLTVPVCRVFLERGQTGLPARFCYNGPAFRTQEGKPDPLRPREFRQSGIEYFGAPSQDADIEVLALLIDAVTIAGLHDFSIRLGHIGIFSRLLEALDMPKRWRDRLFRAFWPPRIFRDEVRALAEPNGNTDGEGHGATIETELGLFEYIRARNIEYIGLRRPEEVIERLKHKAQDAKEQPLPKEYVTLLESYLRIHGPLPDALSEMHTLFDQAGVKMDGVLEELDGLSSAVNKLAKGVPLRFAADFGRHFSYYTGMVFQIERDGMGIAGQVAGGGRYDTLIRALSGGEFDIPAVGGAIHTERLLAATAGR